MAETLETRVAGQEHDAIVPEVLAALRGLRYGSVEITVHDGRVAQIDRRERRRFVPQQGGSKGHPGGEHEGRS